MKSLLVAALAFISTSCFAQYPYDAKRDNLWPFGYGAFPGQTDPLFGLTWLNYSTDTFKVQVDYADIDLRESNVVGCDTAGNLLFVTNGIFIFDSTKNIMQGCDTLSPGKWAEQTINIGYIVPQGVLALPNPGSESEWHIFHSHMSNTTASMYNSCDIDVLYYTTLNMQLNSGLGAVTSMRNPIITNQYMDYGKLTACRHANGRDWWILVFNDKENQYSRLLLTPNGVQVFPWISLNLPQQPYLGIGQAVFTDNGDRYLIFNTLSVDSGDNFEIFDFDRCEGLLTNPMVFHATDTCFAGGIATSASGRFAYTTCGDCIYQYDLEAADIESTKTMVAQWDGFTDPEFPVGTLFYLAEKTPDEKIIICSPNGVRFLHTIDSPDSAGLACNVLQHNIPLYTFNGSSMSNYPNFRLGPVDGSSCDTLGIDVGIAEPPKQAYNQQPELEVYPNPAGSYCNIGFGSTSKQGGWLVVHDLSGQKVFEVPLQKATIGYTLKVEDWVSGLYLCTLYEGNTEKGSVRFVKE